MDYQEIENKLVEFAHIKENKEYPIHEVSTGTAVDFALQQVKNCSIPVLSQQRELLMAYFEWEQKQDMNIESYQKSYLIDEFLDSL